jgi:hypothetical protein
VYHFELRDATFFEDICPMRDMHSMSSWESDPIPKLGNSYGVW